MVPRSRTRVEGVAHVIPVLMLLGLCVALSLMTTTRAEREAVGRRWVRPLEPWAWGITAAVVLALTFDWLADLARRF